MAVMETTRAAMHHLRRVTVHHGSGEHVQSRRSWCTIPPETVHNVSGIIAALVVHPRRSD